MLWEQVNIPLTCSHNFFSKNKLIVFLTLNVNTSHTLRYIYAYVVNPHHPDRFV